MCAPPGRSDVAQCESQPSQAPSVASQARPELKLENSRLWCEVKEKDREVVEDFLE